MIFESNVSPDIEPPQLTLVPDTSIFWPWLRQVIAVALIPVVFELFEGGVLGWSEVSHSPLGARGIQVFNGVTIAVLGFTFGMVVSPKFRGRSAPFIWILPVTMLLLTIAWDLKTFHSWQLVWTEYFFWENPGADEGPILRDFLTYPALSATAYSAAAFAAVLKARGRCTPRPQGIA